MEHKHAAIQQRVWGGPWAEGTPLFACWHYPFSLLLGLHPAPLSSCAGTHGLFLFPSLVPSPIQTLLQVSGQIPWDGVSPFLAQDTPQDCAWHQLWVPCGSHASCPLPPRTQEQVAAPLPRQDGEWGSVCWPSWHVNGPGWGHFLPCRAQCPAPSGGRPGPGWGAARETPPLSGSVPGLGHGAGGL